MSFAGAFLRVFPILLAAGLLISPGAARAQSDGFYKGKSVSVFSYSGPASAYTLYARLLAQYMPNYLDGKPNMIIRNMEGAGGLKLTKYLYEIARKDGTEFGTIQRGILFEPLLGGQTIDFDPQRFTWLGSMNQATILQIAWHTAKVKKVQDLLSNELLLAGTGAGSDAELISWALNGIFGTKIKIIPGYQNANAAALAMERGEVEAINWGWDGLRTSHPHWVSERKVNILFQGRLVPNAELPDVPSVYVLAQNEQQRQALNLLFSRGILGQPFLAPPDLPAERVTQLRQAFLAVLKDPGLLADAAKMQFTIEAVSGEDVARVLREAYATPDDVVQNLRKAMGR